MHPVPLFVLLLVASLPAQAQSVYTWTDADGTPHYTNDPSAVPKGRAVSAVVVGSGNVSTITASPQGVPAADQKAPKPEYASTPGIPEPAEAYWRERFHSAVDRIRQLEDEIASDAKEVEEVNGLPVRGRMRCGYAVAPGAVYVARSGLMVTTTGQVGPGLSVSATGTPGAVTHVPVALSNCWYSGDPEFERIKHRLAKNRLSLARAKEDLEDLDRKASFESVPREWRR